MEKKFTVIMERDPDGGYIASVPALQGCFTQADSMEELRERIKEVIELCLEDEQDFHYTPPLECFGCEIVSVQGI